MRKKIKVPIYDCIVYVYIEKDIDSGIKRYHLKDKFNVDEVAYTNLIDADAIVHRFNGNDYILLLSEQDLSPGVISHECLHVVNRVFEYIGYSVAPCNDECQTYFLNWLVNEVSEIVMKYKKTLLHEG